MTRRERVTFAGVLVLLGIVGLMATCSSCVLGVFSSARSPAAQTNAAVLVRVACPDGIYTGTGVLVGAHHVLTAAHVARCALDQKAREDHRYEGLPSAITVDMGDGMEHSAREDVLLAAMDLSRLTVDDDLSSWTSKIDVGGLPSVGEHACVAAMAPRPSYRCGLVQPGQPGEVYVGILPVEYGNSGSGVYVDGKLIGLMVRVRFCQGGLPCLGIVSPLAGREWLIEE